MPRNQETMPLRMGWQERRQGSWFVCPGCSRAFDKGWGKTQCVPAHPSPSGTWAGAANFKCNHRRKREDEDVSSLTLRGPAGLASDVPEGQRWCPRCQQLIKTTFPVGAGGAGQSWPPAARVPLTVPCNWAERDSWCCWYLSATASAFRSCVCSS